MWALSVGYGTKSKREDKLSYENRPAGSEYALVHATLDRSVCEA